MFGIVKALTIEFEALAVLSVNDCISHIFGVIFSHTFEVIFSEIFVFINNIK
ncbi:MAG: hypothetical protein LBQ59_00080 [Candidatus Peribacteria bacterium]|nr:hypothetical protein [Candidatus Peribacteria bacterium]